MTWVVGAVSPLGHAFIISDTRVTFSNGLEADLIQKSYCIGQYMVAGFAGSVRIGFHLLAHLNHQLRLDDENAAWEPNVVGRAWSRQAAAIFASHSDAERRLGCSIILGGSSPSRNNGDGPWAKTYLMRLASPNFVPGFSRNGFAALQIGSGTSVAPYRQLVKRYFRDPTLIVNFTNFGGHGIGQVLAGSLSQEIRERPTPGVSPLLHVVSCGRGELQQSTINYRVMGSENSPSDPRFATSYDEFCGLAKDQRRPIACALS